MVSRCKAILRTRCKKFRFLGFWYFGVQGFHNQLFGFAFPGGGCGWHPCCVQASGSIHGFSGTHPLPTRHRCGYRGGQGGNEWRRAKVLCAPHHHRPYLGTHFLHFCDFATFATFATLYFSHSRTSVFFAFLSQSTFCVIDAPHASHPPFFLHP